MELREQSSLNPVVEKELPLPESGTSSLDSSVTGPTGSEDVNSIMPEVAENPQNASAENEPLSSSAADVASTVTVTRYQNKEEVIGTLVEISLREPNDISREDVAHLKQVFYAIRKNELLKEKLEFVEAGNDEADFVPAIDSTEARLHEILETIRQKKSAYVEQQERERNENLEKKKNIIAQLIEMADDTDNVNRHYQRVRELQQEFKDEGEVPPESQTAVWRDYQGAVERFYDQLKVNKDLRDYDFRKNLEVKQQLIADAEALDAMPDVISAFNKLQILHNKWRETGPVAKELRDEIWDKFKTASAVVNKKYQAFFEERKARERENEEKKTALCERIEAYDYKSLKSHSQWEQMTRDIIAAQEEWRKLGFASKKLNNALFVRFRKTCDDFFAAKAEFFKGIRDSHVANLEKKIALCEKAEQLKDSTDWKKTGEMMMELQKEWKTIGPVEKKHSDAVWRRFLDACDYFFDARKKATSGTRKAEQANLRAKNDIIASLKGILEHPAEDRGDAAAEVRALMNQWQEIGHVPFKDKDKVYESYREVLDRIFDTIDMHQRRDRMADFANQLQKMGGSDERLSRERERLARILEQKRGELKTYENNLGFLSVKSKSGNSLLKDMERKAERLRQELDSLQEKIRLIDDKR